MYTYDPRPERSAAPPASRTARRRRSCGFEPPGFRSINKTADVLASESGPFMTNDGRVAFTTSDALVPQDTDGMSDVYEFVDSRPRLISSGTEPALRLRGQRDLPARIHRVSSRSAPTGSTSTSRPTTRSSPQDHNGPFIKFYDARTNGGFPIPPPPAACVAADECHGDRQRDARRAAGRHRGEPGRRRQRTAGAEQEDEEGQARRRKRACTAKVPQAPGEASHRHAARPESRNG